MLTACPSLALGQLSSLARTAKPSPSQESSTLFGYSRLDWRVSLVWPCVLLLRDSCFLLLFVFALSLFVPSIRLRLLAFRGLPSSPFDPPLVRSVHVTLDRISQTACDMLMPDRLDAIVRPSPACAIHFLGVLSGLHVCFPEPAPTGQCKQT